MDLDSLRSRLRRIEPIILRDGAHGGLRVLEKSGRVACDVPSPAAADEEQLAAELEAVLTRFDESDPPPPVRLSVNLVHEALSQDDICPALVALADLLGEQALVHVTLHFAEPPQDWAPILSRFKVLRETLSRPKEVTIQVSGPFAEFHEPAMESLFNLGVRLRFAAGWTGGCPSDQTLQVDKGVLRSFSEFGFRAMIEWYVHAGNLTEFEERIPDLLLESFSSGFSLPLVSANPYYQFAPGFPALPEASQYCQLLVRNYKQYPYYDDVLSPLNGLALLIKEGGWQYDLNVPTAVQAVVDAEGRVGLYRQSPALALPWTSVSELAAVPLAEMRGRFLQFVADDWQWDKNPYCRGCHWRHVCGGLDAFGASPASTAELDTICGHRKLFLEHFAVIRAADCVVEACQELIP